MTDPEALSNAWIKGVRFGLPVGFALGMVSGIALILVMGGT